MQSAMKEKPYQCVLCGKTDNLVAMYIGGYAKYAHMRCAEIGNKAIDLHMRRIANSNESLRFLLEEFNTIYKEIDDSLGETKK